MSIPRDSPIPNPERLCGKSCGVILCEYWGRSPLADPRYTYTAPLPSHGAPTTTSVNSSIVVTAAAVPVVITELVSRNMQTDILIQCTKYGRNCCRVSTYIELLTLEVISIEIPWRSEAGTEPGKAGSWPKVVPVRSLWHVSLLNNIDISNSFHFYLYHLY